MSKKKNVKGKNRRRKGQLLPSLSGIRSARRLADGYQDSATSLQEGGLRVSRSSPVGGLRGEHDPVEHPSHYTSHPSGIECIQVTEHMGFNLGNAVKYIWRADLKGKVIEDLKKAVWYIEREIKRREAQA